MEPVVHFRAAVSLVGRFPALAGLTLDVAAGEIVHLEGPNGAGKSTLLRACAGLVRVVDGTAVVLGHDLRSDPAAVRRQVGLLAHETSLYDDLTVDENVRFWTRAAAGDLSQAEAAMSRLGLGERLRHLPVRQLSAGQRRRASLACVLARRPRLWLLDEPHAGLDQEGRDTVDGLIREAVESGVTVMVASHELERAGGLGGRRVTIAGGVVVPAGRSARPAVPEVASAP